MALGFGCPGALEDLEALGFQVTRLAEALTALGVASWLHGCALSSKRGACLRPKVFQSTSV